MKAREFFERMGAPEAPPVEAPPQTTPAAPPQTSPAPAQQPDPWRRREMEPGEAPEPKAAYGMDTTYTESNAQRVVSAMLEDHKG